MQTQGELEAAIANGMSRFMQESLGRGPKETRAQLLGDQILIRMKSVLTPAEQSLISETSTATGRDLLKQVRRHLIETSRPVMQAMVENIIGVKIVSMHHDISTVTGEKVIIFTLVERPLCR